jgi:multidrug transporter EmrE-like cation transporter
MPAGGSARHPPSPVHVKYLHLSLAVAFNVGAYIVFKAISDRNHGLLWAVLFALGLLLGAVNVFFFTNALKDITLAVAYPVFAGASIALLVVVSAWLFGETVSVTNIAGAALVVAGIFALTR